MKKLPNNIFHTICFLLILLWVYAAASKLMDFETFKAQMHRQVLFPFVKKSIVYFLPPIEISTALLLIFERLQRVGLYVSLIMLSAFTIYIGLAILKVFGKIPCSCGGVLSKMGWNTHLVFNIFFLLLTALGIYIAHRERRPANL
jgi:putative oxidoreductase